MNEAGNREKAVPGFLKYVKYRNKGISDYRGIPALCLDSSVGRAGD